MIINSFPNISLFFLGALIVQWLMWPGYEPVRHVIAAAIITLLGVALTALWPGRGRS